MYIFLFSLYLIYILYYISSLPALCTVCKFLLYCCKIVIFLLHLLYIPHIPTVPCAVHSIYSYCTWYYVTYFFTTIVLVSNPCRHLSKIQNGRHKQRSGHHTLARQKYIQKNPVSWTIPFSFFFVNF
jgi:hypothetical protein